MDFWFPVLVGIGWVIIFQGLLWLDDKLMERRSREFRRQFLEWLAGDKVIHFDDIRQQNRKHKGARG